MEYRFSVQELDLLAGYSKEEKDVLLHLAIIAFSKSRNLRLVPYEGVIEVLQWLHRSGYQLIAYTDAPHRHSANRLKKLGIKSFFDVLIAWGPSLPDDKDVDMPEHINRTSGWYVTPEDKSYLLGSMKVLTHPSAEKKPNKALLQRLVDELAIDVSNSWVVGDSVDKDLLPGMELGFKGAWAKYGKEFDAKNWETLVSVSPWDAKTIRKEEEHKQKKPIEPDCVLESFYSLRDVVGEIQRSLF